MNRIDFIQAFYSRQHSRDDFVAGLDSLLTSPDVSVCAIPFSSDLSLDRLLATPIPRRKISLERSTDGLYLYALSYQRTVARQRVQKSGRFFVYEHPQYPGVFVAITIEPSEFVDHGLLPALKSKYPLIVRPFISHSLLKNLLVDFQTHNRFSDLIITRASQRFRFKEEGKHRRIMPIVSWPDMSLDEAFTWVRENDGWFRSVQFEARDDLGRVKGVLSLKRNGVLRTDRLFSRAFRGFVDPICEAHHHHVALFSNRSRRDSERLVTKPLMIDFGTEQFADHSENVKFIQAMKKMKTASVSVLHGNPYINISVADYYDGSSFDIWVLSSNHLVLVPQMKGTVAAIKRLINHIFDSYAEGRIRDYCEAMK